MKPNILAEGFHFSDPNLINRESDEVSTIDRKTTKTQALEILCGALEKKDLPLVKNAVELIWGDGMCAAGTAANLTRKIAGIKDIPHQALDLLDERQAIDRAAWRGAMRTYNNWDSLSWILRDRENILLFEENGSEVRNTNNGGQRRSCLDPLLQLIRWGGAGRAPELDLAFILRDLSGDPGEIAGKMFISSMGSVENRISGIARLAETIWLPETYRLMKPGLGDEEIQESLVRGCSVVVRQILNDDDLSLNTARKIEGVVESSPRMAEAMRKYWELPSEFIVEQHCGKWSHEDPVKLRASLPGLGEPKHHDLLDCAIRVGAPWVEDALMSKGSLHDEVINRLKNDNGPLMAGLILGFRPAEVHQYASKLVRELGEEWRDAQGRGLGHYIIRACNYPTENLLRSLMRSKVGVKLLSETDGGKTALSFLEEHEEWKGTTKRKADLIQRARRKVLESISSNTKANSERVKAGNILF